MEGADPIVEPSQAVEWWNLGLRSVNLAHYGKSRYAVGTGDDGPLTTEGVQLLKEFEQLGMILDATHLSDTSFFQALDIYRGPVLASHNNCRALVPDGRQFTDEQIRLLIDRDAVIGAALDAWMLVPGLDPRPDQPRGRPTGGASATTSTTSASLPATAGTPRSAATSTAASAPSRRPLGMDRISDLQNLGEILARRGYAEQCDRRHLPRQLAAVLPQEPAGLSEDTL